jgi:hypothetical protein
MVSAPAPGPGVAHLGWMLTWQLVLTILSLWICAIASSRRRRHTS